MITSPASSPAAQSGRDARPSRPVVGDPVGIGFLSGFIVSRCVEMRPREVGEKAGWLWRNQGAKSCTVEPCAVDALGAMVKVLLEDYGHEKLRDVVYGPSPRTGTHPAWLPKGA